MDFGEAHSSSRLANVASGALDKDQTVTYSEMLEHSFYQIINVIQALLLHHGLAWVRNMTAKSEAVVSATRLGMFLVACSPWLLRPHFTVNSFSANYTRTGRDPRAFTSILYRVKKWQYVFYKHFLLHGLNASCTLIHWDLGESLSSAHFFGVYWIGLNTAYVLEFFLQSLVKRGYLSQTAMLAWNMILMGITTLAALQVLWKHVHWPSAVFSLAMNFCNRGREMTNCFAVAVFALAWRYLCVHDAT